MPRLITSTPGGLLRARSSAPARRTGTGAVRPAAYSCLTQLLQEFVAELARCTRARPSRSGSRAGPRRPPPPARRRRAARSRDWVDAAQHGRHGGAARAGAGRHRLAHPALEDARADPAVGVAPPERDVGAVREQLVSPRSAAPSRQVELVELLGSHLDRALRVADRHVLELRTRGRRTRACRRRRPGRREVLRARLARPMSTVHVRRSGDPRADLPGGGLSENCPARSSRAGAGRGSPRARRCRTARPPSRRG